MNALELANQSAHYISYNCVVIGLQGSHEVLAAGGKSYTVE